MNVFLSRIYLNEARPHIGLTSHFTTAQGCIYADNSKNNSVIEVGLYKSEERSSAIRIKKVDHLARGNSCQQGDRQLCNKRAQDLFAMLIVNK